LRGWVFGREGRGLRRGGAQAETAGAACYDGDLALDGEEGGEVVELGFGHCGLWREGVVLVVVVVKFEVSEIRSQESGAKCQESRVKSQNQRRRWALRGWRVRIYTSRGDGAGPD
jgi:hypothetical protein